MTDTKTFVSKWTDNELSEHLGPSTDDGYPLLGELVAEVLRLRKLLGKTKEGKEGLIAQWIEAGKIKPFYAITQVLILSDISAVEGVMAEHQVFDCLIRTISVGSHFISPPVSLSRRVLGLWGVLPRLEC